MGQGTKRLRQSKTANPKGFEIQRVADVEFAAFQISADIAETIAGIEATTAEFNDRLNLGRLRNSIKLGCASTA